MKTHLYHYLAKKYLFYFDSNKYWLIYLCNYLNMCRKTCVKDLTHKVYEDYSFQIKPSKH